MDIWFVNIHLPLEEDGSDLLELGRISGSFDAFRSGRGAKTWTYTFRFHTEEEAYKFFDIVERLLPSENWYSDQPVGHYKV